MTAGTIIHAVALRTGIPFEHVEDIGRGLIQSGAWSDEPPKALAYLLLALMAEAEPKSAASVAKHYHSLTADGYKTAGEFVEDMIVTFLTQARTDFSAWSYRTRIEVMTNTPEVRFVTQCADGESEITYGDSNTTVRRYNVLAGKTLFDICADIQLSGAHV